MSEREKFGSNIREQGLGSTMVDLVFNPITGNFEQVPQGTPIVEGQVVTSMTRDGFAV